MLVKILPLKYTCKKTKNKIQKCTDWNVTSFKNVILNRDGSDCALIMNNDSFDNINIDSI